MKKFNFLKAFILFIFIFLFGNNYLSSQGIPTCKVIFCTCCEENFYYEIYHAGPDTLVGTFNTTQENGCSHVSPQGANLVIGRTYYVIESNPNCDQAPIRVYFTACICSEQEMVIKVPCCQPSDSRGTNSNQNGKPSGFKLSQNFPNPFNPVTKIDFEVPEVSNVKITIFDVTGKVVEEILNANVSAGYHSILWNTTGKDISSGIYFYKLEAGNYTDEKKMVLIK